jgi:hypothetical protein
MAVLKLLSASMAAFLPWVNRLSRNAQPFRYKKLPVRHTSLRCAIGYFTVFYQRVLLFSACGVWNDGYVFSTRRNRGLFIYRVIKNLFTPDDYNTKIDDLKMAITEYIRNMNRAILNTVFENTVRRVNKCLETGGGHFEHYL